jgi:hypothetical protein
MTFCAGFLVSISTTLLTVPKRSFIGFGALTADTVYSFALFSFGICLMAILACLFMRHFLPGKSGLSTDEAIAKMMNPSPAGGAPVVSSQLSEPPMRLAKRDQQSNQAIDEVRPFNPKITARPEQAIQAEGASKIQKPSTVKTVGTHSADEQLGEAEARLLRVIAPGGMAMRSSLEEQFDSAELETILASLASKRFILQSGKAVVITTEGLRIVTGY